MKVLQENEQQKMSEFANLYERLIPQDHMLRRMNDLVDYGFVREELRDKYCLDNGRNAVDPAQMFKYLLLKAMYNLSDRDLVEHCMYDMSYKYFLGLRPEDEVIDSSSLTKFRKLRLTDENILDLLIGKSVEIAIEQGIIKSKTIIVDATHTKSRYNQKSAYEVLQEQAKQLRKAVYRIDEGKKADFPAKVSSGVLEDAMTYCRKLAAVVQADETLMFYPPIAEKLRFLEEIIEDNAEHLKLSADKDAKVGHKTTDTSFFGYKTHLAMSDERIITAATITTGEKSDGKELEALVEKSRAVGMDVETVLGDTAYSGKENLELAQDNFELISKLNPIITQGTRTKEDEFEFNKDAGMYVCKAGHMAVRKARQGKKRGGCNQADTYYFDIEQCKCCPMREGCYRPKAKSKTYSVTIKQDIHQAHMAFQETAEFKEKARERYKIEAKNGELKGRHGYDVASSSGLVGMQLQGAFTIFLVNIKRILKLMAE